jgi:hypothetical protein
MKHSSTIDSQKEQHPQWKQLLETVNLLVGRLSVAIVALVLLIGLSLIFVGSGNIAHAAATKTLTPQTTLTTSSMHWDGRHHYRPHHGYHRYHHGYHRGYYR